MAKYLKYALASAGLLKTANESYNGVVKVYQAGLSLYNQVKAIYDDEGSTDTRVLNDAKHIQALSNDLFRKAKTEGLSQQSAQWYSDTIANKANGLYSYTSQNDNPYSELYTTAANLANNVHRQVVDWTNVLGPIPAPSETGSARDPVFDRYEDGNQSSPDDFMGNPQPLSSGTTAAKRNRMMKRVAGWKSFLKS